MSPKNLLLCTIMSCCLVFACSNDENAQPDDSTVNENPPETGENVDDPGENPPETGENENDPGENTPVKDYGSCKIPDTKAHQVACSPYNGNPATCAVDYVFDCESLICAVYKDSDPFCTYRCQPSSTECNSDNPEYCKCPEGKECKKTCPQGAHCIEYIKGTSAYYCLPDDIYRERYSE